MKSRKKNIVILAYALAYILFGLNTPFIKLTLDHFPVYPLLFLKFIFASIIVGLASRRKWKKIKPKDLATLFFATLFGYVVAMITSYQGIRLTGGLNEALIYLLCPIALFLFSMRLLKEKFNPKILTGLIIGFIGAAILISAPLLNGESGASGDMKGNLLLLVSVVSAAFGTILVKPVLKKIPAMQATSLRFAMAAALVSPFALTQLNQASFSTFTNITWFAVFYNFVIVSVFGYILYHWGLTRLSGEEGSVMQYIEPMSGVIGSLFILGERMNTIQLLGALLIVWGIYTAEVRVDRTRWLFHHHK
jgi:drug/metabolite transporter (DMT)-like permease